MHLVLVCILLVPKLLSLTFAANGHICWSNSVLVSLSSSLNNKRKRLENSQMLSQILSQNEPLYLASWHITPTIFLDMNPQSIFLPDLFSVRRHVATYVLAPCAQRGYKLCLAGEGGNPVWVQILNICSPLAGWDLRYWSLLSWLFWGELLWGNPSPIKLGPHVSLQSIKWEPDRIARPTDNTMQATQISWPLLSVVK